MTAEQICNLILEISPSVIAILTMLGMVLKLMGEIKVLKKQVVDTRPYDELKAQMSEVIRENYELKKTLNECMTKIDHVRRD